MSKQQIPRPGVLVNRRYNDMNLLAQDTGWKVDFRQLGKGPLEAKALLIGHPELALLRVRFNRSFHQMGDLPRFDWTFGLPDVDSGHLMWKGERTQPGVLINFSCDNHLDVTNLAGEFGGFVFSINDSLLEPARSRLDLPENFFSTLKKNRFWAPAMQQVSDLRRLASVLCRVADTEGEQGLTIWQHIFNEGLPAQLLRATSEQGQDSKRVTSAFRAGALKRALKVINHYEQIPETVNSLCELTGASWSTLERAFKEEFGVGPKAYLKIRRLTAVRSELIRGDEYTRVHEVANRWGFWHMGSFAADYRKQFGELPTETLKNSL